MNDKQSIPQPTPDTLEMPQASYGAPVAPQPQAPLPTPIKSKKPAMLLLLSAAAMVALTAAAIRLFSSNTQPATPRNAPRPTIAATPPSHRMSGIASTGAFLEFSGEIASLSAILNTFVLQDATLAPPVFETDDTFTP